ncbi:hypothetical protein IC582_019038 [Cucumis melo]|uniref:3-oxoacyl-[acyl-carrier-protein] reductase FabG-like n=2 Tax=Cucumis melo TaxID=3656 RepID=A0A1S3C152_CUCME|nr:uncharacterized protein LOC103495831 [Cucumis melo]KAA0025888.1 3-oxoacyl-(acyl-carrier-protein) reductase FabG-like [Cucumis melo var. makuwa]TYK27824.1 3-oxoacyl-(acyl-carrier-protein) reductase FabG-like [Cucumis melo var. makuwa]
MEDRRSSPTHLEPWNCLHGKVVMVTGASSGLGREFCLDLAKAGCRVIAAARRIDRLQSLCDEINCLNVSSSSSLPRAIAVELDISADGKSIEKSVKNAWESFGFIDALVNNAGFRGTVKTCLELSEEEWDQVMGTNLKGSWLVSKYVCGHMRDSKRGGSVISISSISGIERGQLPGGLAYAASKAGINTLTKVMALELGPYNIRVNSIAPGLFKSEITEGLMQKDWLNTVAYKTTPLRTFGTSDPALTTLIRYLIDDSSRYVSGNIYIVDTGATLPGFPIFSSL